MSGTEENAQRRIMVVDDVEDNRAILERHLKRAGFATVLCEDGLEAIRVVNSEGPPDLVLLDWMMPGLSGLETLQTLRERYDENRLPVIMCTALGDESSVVVAIRAGANDYVEKPINFPILMARMKSQLLRREAVEELRKANDSLEDTLVQRTRDLMNSRKSSPE